MKTTKKDQATSATTPTPSPYSKLATFLLCLFVGFFGAHRIYVRRYITALLMMLTVGYCFIGVFIDLWNIRRNRFKDWKRRPVVNLRTKKDTLAMLFALVSPFFTIKVLPSIIRLLILSFIYLAEWSGLAGPEDLSSLRQLASGSSAIQTNIPAPQIPAPDLSTDKAPQEENNAEKKD